MLSANSGSQIKPCQGTSVQHLGRLGKVRTVDEEMVHGLVTLAADIVGYDVVFKENLVMVIASWLLLRS